MSVDVHAHLTDRRLIGEVDRIVNSMQSDSVSKIVTAGYDRDSSLRSADLAKRFAGVYAAVGVHPQDAQTASVADYRLFETLATDPNVVAIGEIGLDYHYDDADRAVQARVFTEQLELADSLRLPVVLHIRDALGDAYKLLKDNKNKLNCGGLLHCYSGSVEMLSDFMRFDFAFSFGGAITFKNAAVRREVAAACPADRLTVETDCPYLTPEPHRGERNEPKYVNLVLKKLAEVRGITFEEAENLTDANAVRFFPKMK